MQQLAEKVGTDFQINELVITNPQSECPELPCSFVFIQNRTVGQGDVFAIYDDYVLVRHINGIAAYLRSELS